MHKPSKRIRLEEGRERARALKRKGQQLGHGRLAMNPSLSLFLSFSPSMNMDEISTVALRSSSQSIVYSVSMEAPSAPPMDRKPS